MLTSYTKSITICKSTLVLSPSWVKASVCGAALVALRLKRPSHFIYQWFRCLQCCSKCKRLATCYQQLPYTKPLEKRAWSSPSLGVVLFVYCLYRRGMVLQVEQLHQKFKKPVQTHTDLSLRANLSTPSSKSINTTLYSCHAGNGASAAYNGRVTIQVNQIMPFWVVNWSMTFLQNRKGNGLSGERPDGCPWIHLWGVFKLLLSEGWMFQMLLCVLKRGLV